MHRITLLVALAIGLSPLLDSAPGTAAPADAPAKPDAGEWGGRAGLQVAWSASDARQKAADYLGSHHAHREAIASTRQCQSCHGAGAAASVLDYVDAAALHPKGPWIGVSVGPADGVLRSQLRLPEGTGVVVTQIVPDSPAQRAGVEVDDVLLSVNGKPVAGGEDLGNILRAATPDGPPLALKLLRAGDALEKQVTPTAANVDSFLLSYLGEQSSTYRIGVNVADPDQTLRRQLRLGDAGLVVTEVKADSPAGAAGVKAGDVLLSINGKRLVAQEGLVSAVRQAADSPVELELLRGGVTLKISVTPAREQAGAAASGNYVSLAARRLDQPRDLMLVYPNQAHVVANDLSESIAPASTQPAAAPADRLEQITSRLDDLRRAVDALRKDLERQGRHDGGGN